MNIIYLDLNYFCPCLLDPTQGYEVRWAIAGKSIVTQLVAKLDDGKFWFEKKNLNYIPEKLGYLFQNQNSDFTVDLILPT